MCSFVNFMYIKLLIQQLFTRCVYLDLEAVSVPGACCHTTTHTGGVFEVGKLWGCCAPDYIVTCSLVVPAMYL